METTNKTVRPSNPRERANVFSILTFAYTFPVFRKGLNSSFTEEDITETLNEHNSQGLGDRLEKAWFKQKHNPSLFKALVHVFGLNYLLLGCCLLIEETVVKISQPLALIQLIKYYTQEDEKISRQEAYVYAGIIVGASFVNVLMGHLYILAVQHFGMKVRVACCSLIYRKSLKLSKVVLGGITIGKLTNLLSNDVHRFDTATLHLHNLWVCPTEVVIIVYLLYSQLGALSTVGVLFMILFVPLQMFMGKKMSEFRLKTALKTDERVRLMNEIISGIQVIKMYTWEVPFAKLVAIVRRFEIHQIRLTSYLRALTISFGVFTTRVAVFLTIITYVLLGNSLKAEYVFVLSSFYNILHKSMTLHLPKGISEFAEVRVSVSRIQKFLTHEEIGQSNSLEQEERFTLNQNGAVQTSRVSNGIELKNISAKWNQEFEENNLKNINLKLTHSEMAAVIGPVGSGKTNLFQVLLKEMPITAGSLMINGTISYASQDPWIFSGTIRQNILFGTELEPTRYHDVIRACCLEHDLNNLPYGDKTLVGERGVTLSGGQKARINLARAVYRKADIYLLDDPLSAVDAHVGKHLFKECLEGFLKNQCRILITHQLQYLQNVSKIILIENGSIIAVGSYKQLQDSDVEFAKQLHERKEDHNDDKKITEANYDFAMRNNEATEVKEHRMSGNISSGVYFSYFKAGGSNLVVCFILLLCVSTQLAASGADYFMSFWVNLEQANSADAFNSDFPSLTKDTCIYIYSGIVGAVVILTILRSLSFFKYCMRSSTNLHNNMFENIVYAPMRFFETNSSGRVLNRFAKDMGVIDETIPFDMISCIQVALVIIGVTALISTVQPWLLGITVVIVVILYLLKIVYISTTQSIKRLEGTTRSPIFAHMSASLQGITTIRAFGAQEILQNEFDHHQDLHSSVYYLFLTLSRAFGFYLDFICVLYIVSVTFSFFVIDTEKYGGNVGLAITQAISLLGSFQMGLLQWSELQTNMTAVERVLEYTTLQREVDGTQLPSKKDWPEQGSIHFQSVSLRYSLEDPYVLKNLNFSIKPKEKIGIVGRTGAGKSSVIYALFQLTKTEGSIFIDDVDITKIPLQNIRSKISIIPQDPVLFSKTIRKNLDPFDDYPDEELWKALGEVELKNVVKDLPEGLNHMMSEGGSNFSVGQRQLVCLARAVIRRNKILVMDEATANVDPQTDTLIQETIRRKFVDCTVLTIAHRLNTVMDSDRILVMEDGNVVEFDHPFVLLNKLDGVLYKMVQQTGLANAETLLDIAKKSYHNQAQFQSEE